MDYRKIETLDRRFPGWRLEYDDEQDAFRELVMLDGEEADNQDHEHEEYRELDFSTLTFNGDDNDRS